MRGVAASHRGRGAGCGTSAKAQRLRLCGVDGADCTDAEGEGQHKAYTRH